MLSSAAQTPRLPDAKEIVVRETLQVLNEMRREHVFAIEAVQAHEKEEVFVIQKAKSILEIKSAGMSVEAKVALVGFQYPKLMKRGELTMKSDAADLIGDKFQHGLADMALAAVAEANRNDLTINVVVDQVWQRFERTRPSLEKELFVRTRAYIKQLTGIAKKTH